MEEQVVRQLDHAIHEVVVDQIFADLFLRASAVHDAGEADNGCRAVRSKPGEGMHDKRQVGLALGCQYSCRSKTWIVDQKRVLIPGPFDAVRRVSLVRKCVNIGNHFQHYISPCKSRVFTSLL